GRSSTVRPVAASCDGLDSNSSYAGPEMVYSITVPAGQILDVKVHTDTEWDSAIAIVAVDQCKAMPTACLAATDGLIGTLDEDEAVSYKNTDASAKEVRVIVEG